MTSKMGNGRTIVYVGVETKAYLNKIVFDNKLKSYDEAIKWLLKRVRL